ncbi:hypothetical protein ACFVXW_39755 [Streptomyces sp. NPDC058251]|uniref:hypothetical protein n=1 Tax=Streptomyces sp. NPDC058251 TaxID=3346404 RepID=UPI0036E7AAE3
MTNHETPQATRPGLEPRRAPSGSVHAPSADGASVRPAAAGGASAASRALGGVARPALDTTGTEARGTGEPATEPLWPRPVRGRHRRPRPRRVVFAVGGLALAAGVLSFVRMTPESVIGGGGSAEAEPTGASVTDTAGNAVTTVEAVPSAAHPVAARATSVLGGASATPTSGVSLVPTPPAPTTAAPGAIPSPHGSGPAAGPPDTTGIPTAPLTTPPPAASTPAAPRPTPSATTHAPTPRPEPPVVCVPIVGICVDDLTAPLGGRH